MDHPPDGKPVDVDGSYHAHITSLEQTDDAGTAVVSEEVFRGSVSFVEVRTSRAAANRVAPAPARRGLAAPLDETQRSSFAPPSVGCDSAWAVELGA